MAAPLPSGDVLRVVPQAAQVNPQAFVNDPQNSFAAINAGLDLGGRLARLGTLSTQIELEQLKRKSEMAQLTHAKALAEHETELIPQQMAAERAATETARRLSVNQGTNAGALAGLNVPTKSAELTDLNLNTEKSLAQARGNAVTGALSGVPAPGAASVNPAAPAQPAGDVLPPALTPAAPNLLDNALAKARQNLVLQGKPPFATDTELKQAAGITTKEEEYVDPQSQRKYKTQVTRGPDQSVLEATPPILTSVSPSEKSANERGPELADLGNLATQTQDTINEVKEYKKIADKLPFYKKGMFEAMTIGAANKNPNGPVSSAIRSVAQGYLEANAQRVNSKITALKNTLGSSTRKDEIKNLANGIGPSNDIANPDKLISDLGSVFDALNGRIKTVQSSMASPTGTSPAPAPKNSEEIRVDSKTGKKYALRNGVVTEVN